MSENSKISDIVLLDELDDLLKRTSPKMASESEITQIDITCDNEISFNEGQPADKDLLIVDEIDDCGIESEDESGNVILFKLWRFMNTCMVFIEISFFLLSM